MSSVGFSYAQAYVQKKTVKDKVRRRAEEVEGGPDVAMGRSTEEPAARQDANSSGFSRRVHPTASPANNNGRSFLGGMPG